LVDRLLPSRLVPEWFLSGWFLLGWFVLGRFGVFGGVVRLEVGLVGPLLAVPEADGVRLAGGVGIPAGGRIAHPHPRSAVGANARRANARSTPLSARNWPRTFMCSP
jgi:hypothetical protein